MKPEKLLLESLEVKIKSIIKKNSPIYYNKDTLLLGETAYLKSSKADTD
jgi:hypothetical protein